MKSILIIDDDPDDCQLLEEILLEVGWNGKTYLSREGGSALLMLKDLYEGSMLPSLVILDIMLPGIGGMDILKRIKLLYPHMPVLLYSTTCSFELVKEAKNHGAIDCLRKATSHAQHVRFGHYILSLVGA